MNVNISAATKPESHHYNEDDNSCISIPFRHFIFIEIKLWGKKITIVLRFTCLPDVRSKPEAGAISKFFQRRL